MNSDIPTTPIPIESHASSDQGATTISDHGSQLLADRTAAVPHAGASDAAKTKAEDMFGSLTISESEKLSAGDHTVKLKDGREFIMHIPPNDGKTPLPVMFVFSGSAEGQWNMKDFAQESGMNTKADNAANKFIAVYPLSEKHMLGQGSKEEAHAWNVLDPNGGVLVNRADSLKQGNDDVAYVKDIVKALPELANVDPSHKNWAAVGFSQGGVFLNYLASNIPDLFPNMALVGTAVDTKYNYHAQHGNADNVAIVNLRADEQTIAFKDDTNINYKIEELAHTFLPDKMVEGMDGLAALNNLHADPAKQMSMYESRLGHATTQVLDFNTPLASPVKDSETIYKPTNPNDHRQVTVFDLPTANHSFPEADPSGKRTNSATKYTEFDTDQKIVDLWMQHNKTV